MATRGANDGRMWTEVEIKEDCRFAREEFRQRRINESLDEYLEEFEICREAVDYVVRHLDAILAEAPDQELLAQIVANDDRFPALRYLTAPPISQDDLSTLLDKSVNQTRLREDIDFASNMASLLRATIDPMRFPWVARRSEPTPEEMHAAKLATTVALATQRVHTIRRSDEKNDLELSVVQLLEGLGFTKVPTPRDAIQSTEDLPRAGEYMLEVTLGADNADCVVGLFDRRRLAIECKGSNSSINSRKRLNKEVVKDAENWKRQFGRQVVSAAALRGVYNPRYVMEAQETPLLIFWGHRLGDLKEFIESTR